MPRGIYKRTKKNKENMGKAVQKRYNDGEIFGFQKGHLSFLDKGSKKRIGMGLKKAYEEKRRIPNYGFIPWNKGKHIKMNDALEIWRRNGGKCTGKNCWNWIEDRSIIEMNKRNNPEYKQWVKKIKKRDNNTCRFKSKNCSGHNIAHHIKGWSKYPKLRYNIDNGIILCQAHHPRTRAEEKRLEPILMALISVSK